MTPDKARELLENATAGPWDHEGHSCMCHACVVMVRNGDEVAVCRTMADNARLIAAAPDLAKLVAGMRYEYTVRVGGSHWLRESDDSKLVLTIDPTRALRHYQQRIMEALAAAAAVKFEQQCRVVRRLVTDEEVVS